MAARRRRGMHVQGVVPLQGISMPSVDCAAPPAGSKAWAVKRRTAGFVSCRGGWRHVSSDHFRALANQAASGAGPGQRGALGPTRKQPVPPDPIRVRAPSAGGLWRRAAAAAEASHRRRRCRSCHQPTGPTAPGAFPCLPQGVAALGDSNHSSGAAPRPWWRTPQQRRRQRRRRSGWRSGSR